MAASGPPGLDHLGRPGRHHVRRREDEGRVEVALDRPIPDERDGGPQRRAPVDADHVGSRVTHQREQVGGADPEVDPRHAQRARAAQDLGGVRHHVPRVVVGGQRARPRVEQLDGARAGGHLDLEVRRGDAGDLAHQRVPDVRGAEHHGLGLRVLLGRPALDEVRRHRERGAGEADQGGGPQLTDQAAHRLGDERDVVGRQVGDGGDVGEGAHRGRDHGAHTGLDVQVDPDRLERQHDVGEEDGRVDAVPPDRLEGDLHDQLGWSRTTSSMPTPSRRLRRSPRDGCSCAPTSTSSPSALQ